MDRYPVQLVALVLGAGMLLTLTGCTWDTSVLQSKKVDYKSQTQTSTPLDVPPDLTPVQADERYLVPGQESGKNPTLTQFNQQQNQSSQVLGGGNSGTMSGILPNPGVGIQFQQDGAQRWLVVDLAPEKLWSKVKEFWTSNGFALVMDEPTLGIMQTDWTSNETAAPKGLLGNLLNKVVNNLFNSPVKDQYRTRLDRGAKPNTTEIYVTQKRMEEVVSSASVFSKDYSGTGWQSMSNDPELEIEYLKKLALYLGGSEVQASALGKEQSSTTGGGGSKAASQNDRPEHLEQLADGDLQMVLADPFDRAWRRVGLALDRSGFTVEDRDRSNGVYYIRFTDAEGMGKKKKEGWLSGLMFWKSDDKSRDTQTYRLTVTTVSGKGSHVDVRDKSDARIDPKLADRILNLVLEQLH